MNKYKWTHKSLNKEQTGQSDNLASAVRKVINLHHPKAKFVCIDLKENDETGDLFNIYFQDKDEIYEFEIATTVNGTISLFNQLAELRRSYDSFDLTTTTI